MIKRNVRIFTRDDLFQEFLDRMDEDTTIAHYSVSKDGMHYIITERQMTDDEAKQFKIKQLEKQIKECNEGWEHRIRKCEKAITRHNVSLEYEMANLYMQRREDLIEEYNEEQRKLTNKLDKLRNS